MTDNQCSNFGISFFDFEINHFTWNKTTWVHQSIGTGIMLSSGWISSIWRCTAPLEKSSIKSQINKAHFNIIHMQGWIFLFFYLGPNSNHIKIIKPQWCFIAFKLIHLRKLLYLGMGMYKNIYMCIFRYVTASCS